MPRADDGWQADAPAGAYWLRPPAPGAEAVIVFTAAIAPEAIAAWEAMADDIPALACST